MNQDWSDPMPTAPRWVWGDLERERIGHMETTLCWKCSAEYDYYAACCPDCGAFNGNEEDIVNEPE